MAQGRLVGAVACESVSRKVTSLLQQLWSDLISENAQFLSMVDTITTATQQRGIYVLGSRRRSFEAVFTPGFALHRAVGRPAFECARATARGVSLRYAETVVRPKPALEKTNIICRMDFGR